MNTDAFAEPLGTRRGLGMIDVDRLLTLIPDPASDGLTEEGLRRLYCEGHPVHDEDFHAKLRNLVGTQVRTTDKTVDGKTVTLYRRSA